MPQVERLNPEDYRWRLFFVGLVLHTLGWTLSVLFNLLLPLSPWILFAAGLLYSGKSGVQLGFNTSTRFFVTAGEDSSTELYAWLLSGYLYMMLWPACYKALSRRKEWRAWAGPGLVLLIALLWRYVNISAAGLEMAFGHGVPCDVHFQAQHAGLPRVVPAAMENGFALAWQESEVIFLQLFDKACSALGSSIQMVPAAFVCESAQSSIQDVKVLSNGTVAVAWLAGGSAWVSLVSLQGAGPAMQVNSAASATRADVQIVPSEGPDFAITWTTLAQDGAARELAFRIFGDGGAGPEILVPGRWRFSHVPRVQWCGTELVSIWMNASSDTQGPFLWSIARDRLWSAVRDEGPPARSLEGSSPGEGALICYNETGHALWLERSRRLIRWKDFTNGEQAAHGSLNLALGDSRQTGTTLRLTVHENSVVLLGADAKGNLKAELLDFHLKKSYSPVYIPIGPENITISFGGEQGLPAFTACGASTISSEPAVVHCARRGYERLKFGDFFEARMKGLMIVAMCGYHASTYKRRDEVPPERATSECAICLAEIRARMAFRPCGHTACSSCAASMLQLRRDCHICRAPIEAALAVYI